MFSAEGMGIFKVNALEPGEDCVWRAWQSSGRLDVVSWHCDIEV